MEDPASQPEVIFEPLHDGVEPPVRSTELSAGYDLRADLRQRSVRVRRAGGALEERTVEEDVLVLEPQEVALVPTGFRARLPEGFEAQVRIRSSLAFRRGLELPNAPGTIDADYPDEWLVMLKNVADVSASITHGERIAQAVLSRFEVLNWSKGEVGISTDRVGGFGSTGAD